VKSHEVLVHPIGAGLPHGAVPLGERARGTTSTRQRHFPWRLHLATPSDPTYRPTTNNELPSIEMLLDTPAVGSFLSPPFGRGSAAPACVGRRAVQRTLLPWSHCSILRTGLAIVGTAGCLARVPESPADLSSTITDPTQELAAMPAELPRTSPSAWRQLWRVNDELRGHNGRQGERSNDYVDVGLREEHP
jgi:hypothetical protein